MKNNPQNFNSDFTPEIPYVLTEDSYLSFAAPGKVDTAAAIFESTPYCITAGGFLCEVIRNTFFKGKNAYRFFKRDVEWDALIIYRDNINWDLKSSEYELFVIGLTTPGVTVKLAAPDEPWSTLARITAGRDGLFEFHVNVSDKILSDVPGGAEQFYKNGIRVHTDCTSDFTVCEIKITKVL